MTEDPIISLHLEKTGGSTLLSVLRQVYGEGVYRTKPHSGPKVAATRIEMHRGEHQRVVHGHLVYGLHEHMRDPFPDKARYITVLRHPVDRIASYYFYMRNKDKPTREARLLPLSEWVVRVAPKPAPVHNAMTKRLSSMKTPDVDVAIDNLARRFAVVGDTSRLPRFLRTCADRFGWDVDLARVPTEKSGFRIDGAPPGAAYFEDLSRREREHIIDYNRLDMQLWELAYKRRICV